MRLLRGTLEPLGELKVLLGRQSLAVKDVILVLSLVGVLLEVLDLVGQCRRAVWHVLGAHGVGRPGGGHDGEVLDGACEVFFAVYFLSIENDSVRLEFGFVPVDLLGVLLVAVKDRRG